MTVSPWASDARRRVVAAKAADRGVGAELALRPVDEGLVPWPAWHSHDESVIKCPLPSARAQSQLPRYATVYIFEHMPMEVQMEA